MLIQHGRAPKEKVFRKHLRDSLRNRGVRLNYDIVPPYAHDYLDRSSTVVPRTFAESKLYSTKRIRPVRYVWVVQSQD